MIVDKNNDIYKNALIEANNKLPKKGVIGQRIEVPIFINHFPFMIYKEGSISSRTSNSLTFIFERKVVGSYEYWKLIN